MKPFKAPKRSLGDLDAEAAATLVAAASDIALVVGPEGVIWDVALGSEELSVEACQGWVGQPWAQVVTAESRPKVEDLLREARSGAGPTWRHVNHPCPRGPDVPVLYSAVQVASRGVIVALGRELRTVASLQQRLVEAQWSMERNYARLRHMETLYRLLFRSSPEAVLIVDAATHKVVEANAAAAELLGDPPKRLADRSFPEGFDADSTQAIRQLLAGTRAGGRVEEVRAQHVASRREFLVSASLFRRESSSLFLVRLSPMHAGATQATVTKTQSKLLKVVESAPDGFVVTDPEGRIIAVNRAFLDLTQLATEEQARGESLERWLGRPGVDLNVLIANLREHGSVRLFATTLRDEFGSSTEVELSAIAVQNGDQPCLGFTLRGVGQRPGADVGGSRELPRSMEQVTELVGRVPLKDLVRESTDLIERLCIEAALELTGDNRASAAEMLGLSRQSLYVKLRRYGLGDLDSEGRD